MGFGYRRFSPSHRRRQREDARDALNSSARIVPGGGGRWWGTNPTRDVCTCVKERGHGQFEMLAQRECRRLQILVLVYGSLHTLSACASSTTRLSFAVSRSQTTICRFDVPDARTFRNSGLELRESVEPKRFSGADAIAFLRMIEEHNNSSQTFKSYHNSTVKYCMESR